MRRTIGLILSIVIGTLGFDEPAVGEIVRDTEYLILEEQNREQWSADDATVDRKLDDFRRSNEPSMKSYWRRSSRLSRKPSRAITGMIRTTPPSGSLRGD